MTNGWGPALQRATVKIRTMDESRRVVYYDALRDSLTRGVEGRPSTVPSPLGISVKYQLSLAELLRTGIVLGKSEAIRFLQSAHASPRTSFALKRLSKRAYQEHFKRGAAVGPNNKLVFTYGEVFSLLGLAPEIEVPRR